MFLRNTVLCNWLVAEYMFAKPLNPTPFGLTFTSLSEVFFVIMHTYHVIHIHPISKSNQKFKEEQMLAIAI